MSAEGEKLMKEAESKTKTGLFRSPDFDYAAQLYTKAATFFKNFKDYKKCLDCHLKASECHMKNKVPYQAAKSLEQAAYAARDMGDLKKTAELINQASGLFYEHGTLDTATSLIDKGGKIIEGEFPAEASEMYRKAARWAQISDKHSMASELLDRAVRLLIKMEKYEEAVGMTKELLQHEVENPSSMGQRFVLCAVLLHLKRNDYVSAKLATGYGERIPGGGTELGLCMRILDFFDRGDRKALKETCNSPFIRGLDPVYAILARSIDVPGGELAERPAAEAEHVQAPGSSEYGLATKADEPAAHEDFDLT